MDHDDDNQTSTLLHHGPCDACGSRDNRGFYSDGHEYCFGCKDYKPGSDTEVTTLLPKYTGTWEPIEGIVKAIPNRNLDEATCKLYDYRVGVDCHIATYRNQKNEVSAQSIRRAGKNFSWVGDTSHLQFYGQHLWSTGKKLTITEGVIDCLSVSQAFGNKWPIVSIPNGVASVAKVIKDNYEWLEGFDQIVLMFDNDKPGREATEVAANLLPIGKVLIATLPLKDPNELLVAGRAGDIVKSFWDAKPFRPDGIVGITDIKGELFTPVTLGDAWPWETLTRITYGRKPGQLFGFGAGVGVGKTDCFTECINYDINTLGLPVGVIYLEQPVAETVQRIAGKMKSKMFHVPDAGWSVEEYRQAVDELEATGKLWLYRHFGEMGWDVIKSKITYFARALNIKHVYLDHLTALVASADDERRALDSIMAQMASLAQELGIIIHLISHLTTPDGKPHEEGGRVMEKHFTGSRAIARWAHYMFGLERNKQAEDVTERSTTTFRVLKDRFTGQATGKTFPLYYNETTGRLLEGAF
jgi:twinkle protein